MEKTEYQELVRKIKKHVKELLPRGSNVVVVSRGDDELLNLDGSNGWHLPQDEKGKYLGYYPADSAQATQWLEQLRSKGGDFLLLPKTSSWWLDHYAQFKNHLTT